MKLLRQSAMSVALLLVATTAFAGSRSATRIKVKNASPGPIAVSIDDGTSQTIEDFVAAGAVYINAGSSRSFRVDAGEHTVYVVDAVNPVFPATELAAYVKKHCTKKVVYYGDNGNNGTGSAPGLE